MTNENKNKRYYWIKLKDTFFTSDTVDFLMSQKNGADYVVLYQMLCLKTVNTNGELSRQIGEILIPFDIDKIQRDCKYFNADTIRVALELYKQLGLIFVQENGIMQITNYGNMVGSETQGAIEKRQQRALLSGIDKGIDNVYQEKDIRDKRIDSRYNSIDIEKESTLKSTKESLGAFSNEVADSIEKWLQYKKEKRQAYKPTGLKALLNKLEKDITENGDQYVINAIDHSIECNYSGIYPPRENAYQQKKDQFCVDRENAGEEAQRMFTSIDNLDDLEI